MRNLRLRLEYNGEAYHGWQLQANAVTVQGKIEDAVETVFGARHTVYGCSRTDAGVHANEFFCNFKTLKSISCGDTVRALNANLPDDIAVTRCDEMDIDFHSRYDCVSKQYIYKIWNSPVRNPFFNHTTYHYKYPLDEIMLNREASDFVGTYDFSSFCSSGSSVSDTVRTVKSASVERDGDFVYFIVEADGFLYNMVRIMTGTLLNINEKKIEENSIKNIIKSHDRTKAGVTAPPQGLYLNKVYYKRGDTDEK